MRALAFSVLLILSAFAAAQAQKSTPLQVADIEAGQARIRSEVAAARGAYKDMPAAKRTELLARQDELLKLIDGKATTDELGPSERVAAFDALEWIKAAVSQAEDERLVCRQEKPIGSHMSVRVCRTVAQIRKEREAAREAKNGTRINSQMKPLDSL